MSNVKSDSKRIDVTDADHFPAVPSSLSRFLIIPKDNRIRETAEAPHHSHGRCAIGVPLGSVSNTDLIDEQQATSYQPVVL